jgi:hypothetical protein
MTRFEEQLAVNELHLGDYQPLPVGSLFTHRMPGRWYPCGFVSTASALATATVAVNVMYLMPIMVPERLQLTGIAFVVTTAGGAGSVGRCGIYTSDSRARGYMPNRLVVDGGEVACDGVTGIKSTVVDVTLKRGLYWGAILAGVATFVGRSVSTTGQWPILGADPTGDFNGFYGQYQYNQAYGAMPGYLSASTPRNSSSVGAVFCQFG